MRISLRQGFRHSFQSKLFPSRKWLSTGPQLPPFDYKPAAYQGPSYEEIQRLRKTYLSPAMFLYYKKPLLITEGKMQYLFDEKGKRYLDFLAGIVTISVGHCHPEIVKAGTDQMKKLMHSTTIYLTTEVSQFAEELAAKMPGDLKVTYFVNSGSEANDLALLMARLYTGSTDIISLRNGYHGMGQGTMGLTALHTWRYPVHQSGGIHYAQNPDIYRGVHRGEDTEELGRKYAKEVKDVIQHETPGKVAGFIAETIQGVGGAVVLPKGYLKDVYRNVREAGGLCIADEVQTGFGRCGTHYWGFETQGVIPDIVTMAKGLGNGAPLAAVTTTPEIARCLATRLHFNTFGGNPVSSAIGRAVLRVLDKENIQSKAKESGEYLLEKLRGLQKKHTEIGDVRGKGLMVGMELVKDRDTREPLDKDRVGEIFEKTKDLGLLIGKGGLFGNVFRIKPPMCISKADIDFATDVLDVALSRTS